MSDALAAPTISSIAAIHGTPAMGVAVTAILHGGMEYFAPQRRMSGAQITMWAEEIVGQFKYESLADIALFMRGAAMSKYDDGEFYGSVDIPRLNKWWSKYLEEKAAAREVEAIHQEHQVDQGAREVIASIPGLKKAVNEFVIDVKERSEMVRRQDRIRHLHKHCPTMTENGLREAWKIYPTAEERSVIQAEAMRRGLMGEELRLAQLEIDKDNPPPTENQPDPMLQQFIAGVQDLDDEVLETTRKRFAIAKDQEAAAPYLKAMEFELSRREAKVIELSPQHPLTA